MTERAEAICARGLQRADALRSASDPLARGRAAAAEVDATLAALEIQIDGFERLRGPESTDDTLAEVVDRLRAAAGGLQELRAEIVDGRLTVNEAIAALPGLVGRINQDSAVARDALTELGFFSCVGLATESPPS